MSWQQELKYRIKEQQVARIQMLLASTITLQRVGAKGCPSRLVVAAVAVAQVQLAAPVTKE